jgi:hypothetical protein
MQSYKFTLIALGMTHLDEVPIDKVLAAGCDDGSVSSSAGRVCFRFNRDGRSLDEAVGSAIVALKGIGIDAFLASIGVPEKVADVA